MVRRGSATTGVVGVESGVGSAASGCTSSVELRLFPPVRSVASEHHRKKTARKSSEQQDHDPCDVVP